MWIGGWAAWLSLAAAGGPGVATQVKLAQEGDQVRILVEAVGVGHGLQAHRPSHGAEVAPLIRKGRVRWKGGRMAVPTDAEWTSSPNALAMQPLGSTWWDLGELRVPLPTEALAAGTIEFVGRVQLTLVDEGVVRLEKHRVRLTLSASG